MKVAVIILNYNSSLDCRKCVSFLKKQRGVELEIVVVDNCSRADDVEQLRQLCKEQDCILIENHENRGYNAGNNIGLRYAAEKGYKYALIANPDMEFPQVDYVKKLAEIMEKNPEVVVCGSDIVGNDGEHQNPMRRDGGWRTAYVWLSAVLTQQHVYGLPNNYQESRYCDKVSGCCLMLRMDFIYQLGFFDERVFLYCEEAILSRQVERAGKRMFYTAEAQAVHRHIKGEKENHVPRFKAWIKSRLYFEREYNYQGCVSHALKVVGWQWYLLAYRLQFALRDKY